MPLSRVQVRSEYGLGQPELYRDADREDPKSVLDGVAVAGLVGILRQLGDLAEFAAEVFHGLQEQVMTTSSRSHKVMLRLHKIEAALPPVEKAALAQTCHIHFAYTAGSDWHARIRNDQNHFIYNDLPRFIMDNYEECRDPPRFNLLDKFDVGGPGSCLKRYTDPTFFKRVSASHDEANAEKSQRDRKARKSKKRRSRKRNGEMLRGKLVSNQSGRMQFASPIVNDKSFCQNGSTLEKPLKSDMETKAESFDSRSGSGTVECVSHLSSAMHRGEESVGLPSSRLKVQPMQQEDEKPMGSPTSGLMTQLGDKPDCAFLDECNTVVDEDFSRTALQQQTAPSSSSFITWDEKTEIVEPKGQLHDSGYSGEILPTDYRLEMLERSIDHVNPGHFLYNGEYIKTEIVEWEIEQYDAGKSPEMLPAETEVDTKERECVTTVHSTDFPSDSEDLLKSLPGDQLAEIESETDNFVDALNTIDSGSESDFDCQTKTEVKEFLPNFYGNVTDGQMHASTMHPLDHHPTDFENQASSCSSPNQGTTWHLHKPVSVEHERSTEMIGIPSDPYISPVSICDNVSNPSCESISRNLSSSSSSTSSSLPPSGEQILSSSPVDIFEKAGNSDKLNFESVSSDPSSSSPTGCSSRAQNVDMHIANSPVTDICESAGDPNPTDFESVGKNPLSSPFTVCSSDSEAPTGGKGLLSSKSVGCSPEPASSDEIVTGICETQEPAEKIPTVMSVNFWTNGGLLGLQPSKPPDFGAKISGSKESDAKSVDAAVNPNNHIDMLKAEGQRMEKDILSEGSKNIEKESSSNCPMPFPNDSGIKITPTAQENDERLFNVFGLTTRILANGFQRKASVVLDDKTEPADGHYTVADQPSSGTILNDKLGRGYLADLPSSPPLEHMKISFHPINGFDNSKLKLKFPDRSECHESIGDIFPSFQLVPESTVLPHETSSDSDDDTFCRSSPGMTDDYLSQHSESDSEQWKSGKAWGSKDHELSLRSSSMEFIPSSLELEGMINVSNRVDCEYDCPSEKGVELSYSGQLGEFPNFDTLDPLLKQEIKNVSAPKDLSRLQHSIESAPLPPPLPPLQWRAMNSHSDAAEGEQDNVSDSRDLEASISEQPGPAPARQQHIAEQAVVYVQRNKDVQELNGHKEVAQAANGKEMDERTDFLQQIRTKSFNLRRTATARPTLNPVPTANFKVTAILEKANAIRQAVGSDDGDDEDNWSDM